MNIAYKMLNANGSAPIGNGSWHLPKGNRPGKWMPVIKDLAPCRSGYHVARNAREVLAHAAPVVWRVEYRGDAVDAGGKLVVAQARLLPGPVMGEREWRLFAADCAERVLPIFERERPDDNRPRRAVEVARAFANGEATTEDLAAARAAAWAAARAAAGAAARAAAWAAARAAAGDAAGDAARAAAWAAVGAAELDWRYARLTDYLEGKVTQ